MSEPKIYMSDGMRRLVAERRENAKKRRIQLDSLSVKSDGDPGPDAQLPQDTQADTAVPSTTPTCATPDPTHAVPTRPAAEALETPSSSSGYQAARSEPEPERTGPGPSTTLAKQAGSLLSDAAELLHALEKFHKLDDPHTRVTLPTHDDTQAKAMPTVASPARDEPQARPEDSSTTSQCALRQASVDDHANLLPASHQATHAVGPAIDFRAKVDRYLSTGPTHAVGSVIDCDEIDDHYHSTGPTDLRTTLEVNPANFEALQMVSLTEDLPLVSCLKDTLEATVVITESYAGDGAGSHAAAEIVDDADTLGIFGKLVVYASWDSSPLAHKCLRNHGPKSRPRHRFGDVSERAPVDELLKLQHIEANYLQQYDDLVVALKGDKDGQKLPDPNMSKDLYNERCAELGDNYVTELCTALSNTHFLATAHCYEHDRQCPISPRSDPALRTRRCSFLFHVGHDPLPHFLIDRQSPDYRIASCGSSLIDPMYRPKHNCALVFF